MKKISIILSIFFSITAFSQKKVLRSIEMNSDRVIINSKGLDNITLENSNSNKVEVMLYAESYDDQLIKVEEKNNDLNIGFYFEGTETREVVFRKFITKRLQRAEATIKIPANKMISIFGQNVDIESKSCNNEIEIYIDNGIVKLNDIQQNTLVKLYAGNLYAITKSIDLAITSNLGKIQLGNKTFEKKLNQSIENSTKKLTITSIKANIFLTKN
ncbi:MAG: hypothetical protein HWD82_01130 [Flavobacteriaceae bacterium]|nr:hypothetical protein [Flavobacteriaceae bacterium]